MNRLFCKQFSRQIRLKAEDFLASSNRIMLLACMRRLVLLSVSLIT